VILVRIDEIHSYGLQQENLWDTKLSKFADFIREFSAPYSPCLLNN